MRVFDYATGNIVCKISDLPKSVLCLDTLFVCMCICFNAHLVFFVINHTKRVKSASKSKQERMYRFAARMSIVIFTSTVTWAPMIILQIVVAAGHAVRPAIFLWVLLTSFSFNLIFDPILVFLTAIKM